MYKIVEVQMGDKKIVNIHNVIDDNTTLIIPLDPANSDYQAYLVEQSTPNLPA